MRINGSIALVSGASRGLGAQFVDELFKRGARKVYAAARDPADIAHSDATPVRLDITDTVSVCAAAELASDATLIINNAGVSTDTHILADAPQAMHLEFDTNVFGMLNVSRTFAPILRHNGGGAIVNVLSSLSWVAIPDAGAYCAAKAAAWSATNSLRIALAGQQTLVTALHLGLADTDMAAGKPGPKSSPETIVKAALDGVELGKIEVLADEPSRRAKALLSSGPSDS